MRLLSHHVLTTALLATVFSAQAAVISDFAADFSATTNVSGNWQYGSSATNDSAFILSQGNSSYGDNNGAGAEVKAWNPVGTFWPTVALNTSNNLVGFGASNVIQLQAQQGLLHPGAAGDFAVVRLTVANAINAQLQVAFEGIDLFSTTTDVHVNINGINAFGGLINS